MPADRTPMGDIDAEAIARVLDGRATAEERARLLARADESPELLALLADTAAIMNAENAGVVDIASRRPRRIARPLWIGIAAAAIVAVVIPSVLRTSGEVATLELGGIRSTPAAVAEARSGASLTGMRGADDNIVRQSVVLGARIVDYATLSAARDTGATTAALEIASALRSLPNGSVAAASFAAPGSSLTPEMVRNVEGFVDVPYFRAAGWAEWARLAAMSGDSSVLHSSGLQESLRFIARSGEFPETARALARRMSSDIEKADLAAVGKTSADLLAALHDAK